MFFKQNETLILIHNYFASISRKDVFATSKKNYTEVFKTLTIYMFEKVIETLSVKFSQIIIIQV